MKLKKINVFLIIIPLLGFFFIGVGIPLNSRGQLLSLTNINDFVGIWVNTDENTSGITTIKIGANETHLDVNFWEKCHPEDCDWGEVTILYESPVTVVYTFSDKITTNILTLLTEEKNPQEENEARVVYDLLVSSDNVYTDGSNRDYTAEYYFRLSKASSFPWEVGTSLMALLALFTLINIVRRYKRRLMR